MYRKLMDFKLEVVSVNLQKAGRGECLATAQALYNLPAGPRLYFGLKEN